MEQNCRFNTMSNVIVKLSDDALQKMKLYAIHTYPYECCGILLGVIDEKGEANIQKIISVENMSDKENAWKYFEIDPLKLYEYEKKIKNSDYTIVGFFHSHPDEEAVLSNEDERRMIPKHIYIILSVSEKKCEEISAWMKTNIDSKAEKFIIQENSK